MEILEVPEEDVYSDLVDQFQTNYTEEPMAETEEIQLPITITNHIAELVNTQRRGLLENLLENYILEVALEAIGVTVILLDMAVPEVVEMVVDLVGMRHLTEEKLRTIGECMLVQELLVLEVEEELILILGVQEEAEQ